MKRIITAILCGVLFAGILASAASAQPMGPGGGYYEGQGSYAGGYGGGQGAFRTTVPGNFPEHLYLGFTGVDEGLGFEGSYFTVGGLFPFYTDGWNGIWYNDDRLHLSENGGFFGNFGIGRRQLVGNTAHGLGLWYSVDDDQWDNFGHRFHEIGASLEVINPEYEIRFNGYLPISNTDFTYGTPGNPFVGNQLLIQTGVDTALAGMDGEFGVAVPGLETWAAKAFVGYYFYDPLETTSAIRGFGGARARVEFSPAERVSFNFQVNHDDTFDTTGFLTVNWHLYGARHPAVSSHTLQPIVRNAHIVRVHQDAIIATNPNTGLAYNVLHVNNTAGPGGDGTIDAPFRNLTEVQNASMPDDLIYVHGTGLQYTNTIALQDRQLFIGSGPGNVFIPTVEVGSFLMPSITDVNPLVGNPLGPSVFLADDNLVGRITFNGQTGISGNGINNTMLIANTFLNNTLSGAVINNSTGTFLVQGNEFNGAGVDGIRFQNSIGTFNIFNNEFFNNTINGANLLNTQGNAFIVGNNFGNNVQFAMPNGTGLRVTAQSGTMNVLLTQNMISANFIGAHFQSQNIGTTLNTTVTGNDIRRNNGDALQFIANTGSTSNINIFDQDFVSNGTVGGAAVRVVSTNPNAGQASTANVMIENVVIDVGAGGIGGAAGISLSDTGNANYFAMINDLTIDDPISQGSTGAGLNATFGNTNGTASLVTVTNSIFRNVTGAGLNFAAGGGLGGVQITNVLATGNGTGISSSATAGILDLHIDNSQFLNNTGDGMNVAMSGTGVHLLTVNNSAFNNNGDMGFEMHATPTASQFFGFFFNNAFQGNGGAQDFLGQIDVGGNPPLHAGTLVCMSFSQNVASSNYVLNNNANPATMPPEVATFLFEQDGTNVPGFTVGGANGLVPAGVPFGTCAVAAAPFRILPP